MRYDLIDVHLFIRNRQRLTERLLPGSLAVVNANDVLPTNADGTMRLYPNSDLFYLTGVEQEESVLLLFPEADEEKHREILFLRRPNPHLALWEGHKLSAEKAQELSGVRTILWLDEFPGLFHRLMCECQRVYLNSNEHKRALVEVETREARFVRECQRRYPLHEYHRLAPLLHQLRVVKSDQELELIRKACHLTGQGLQRVLRFIRPGVGEWEIEAELAHEFIRHRSQFAGYAPIIASGSNACVLHYQENNQVCRKGDLVLMDFAAAWANYQSDLTRTVPVSGRFSKRQKQIYGAVLRVLRGAVEGMVVGKLPKVWQKETEALMQEELLELGLIKRSQVRRQDPDKPALKKFFMHGVGHPMGLDVHDVGITSDPMAPGWVLTCEPGIYLPDEGFGIRLENDVLVTEDGPVDLTADIPIEVEEIEAGMRQE